MAIVAAGLALGLATQAAAAPDWVTTRKGPWTHGAFDKDNLEKARPAPPFDLTGTWQMRNDPKTGGFNFIPLAKFTPAGQKVWDAYNEMLAKNGEYYDDAGHCWPSGMPRWLTRFWPIQYFQYPTVIVGIQALLNSNRWIYLDGRGHADPDITAPTYNGDSIARWEGDTLVIHTNELEASHHWITHGIPMSDQLEITERIRMAPDKQSFTNEITMVDPVNWVGEWKNTKTYIRQKGIDPVESECLPEGNVIDLFSSAPAK